MRILLTGSRGYIGTVMAPMMVEAGHDVLGVDTDLYRLSTFGPWRESIRTIEKDVRALEAADLKGFDAVVHLAALSNDPLGDQRWELELGGKRVLLVHSTPWEPRGAYIYPESGGFDRFAEADADFVLYGHTHRQVIRSL